MNKQRREKIREIRKNLENCKESLQRVLDEEQITFDNMPENLQCSLRGSESEDTIDTLESCIDNLENIIKELVGI